MFCEKCGKELPDNARFCDSCGCEITKSRKEKKTKWSLKKRILVMIPLVILVIGLLVAYDYYFTLNYKFTKEGITVVDCGKYVKKAKIPDSVTSIGDQAFSDCYGLKSLKLPKSVTYVGYGMVYNCNNLENLMVANQGIPQNLQNVFSRVVSQDAWGNVTLETGRECNIQYYNDYD